MKTYLRIFVCALLLGLATPLFSTPPGAVADTTLGGYTASAESSVVRIGIYEPAVPIPADPQVDVSLGYARSTTSTGPTSRALASYLWPGDALGDGLGTIASNEAFDYPVKVNSKYPAGDSAPAKNTAQITDGNGMTTSANDTDTRATVTGLKVGGNLVSGIGSGLCSLLKQKCPGAAVGVPLPLPIATAASIDAIKADSSVQLKNTVTSTAHLHATGLQILAGLITIDGFDMTGKATSNGTKGTTGGNLTITGLEVAGKKVALQESVNLDDPQADVPKAPLDFPALGISIKYLNRTQKVDGASGKLAAEGLTITVDVGVLGKQLKLGMLSDVLGPVIGDIPQLGPLLTGLLKFGTKIVITVGDVRVGATAVKGYVAPPFTEPTAPAPVVAPPVAPVTPDSPVEVAVPPIGPVDVGVPETSPLPETTVPPVANVASPFRFPGLSRTPSLLLLAALALAGLVGWGVKGFGTFFFAADDCDLGASVGVPNLREV